MTAKKTKPVPPAVDADEAAAVEEEEENQLPWDQELALWEQEEKQEGETSKFILYRRPEGKTYKEKVWEWLDENPGSHAVGLEFGGGRYMMYAVLPGKDSKGKPRFKSRSFVLAHSYTESKRRRDMEQGFAPQYTPMMGRGQGPQAEQRSGMDQLGDIFDRIVIPMMTIMQKSAGAAPANPFDTMKGMGDLMTGMIQENARSTMRLVNEVTKEMATNRRELAGPAGEGEGQEELSEEDEFSIKDFVKEMIHEYGPGLLKSTGLSLKAKAAVIKDNEIFQALSANKALFDRVVYLLGQDPDVDQMQTRKVLDKLAALGIGAFVPVRPAGVPPRAPAAPRPDAVNGHNYTQSSAPSAAAEGSHAP